MRAAVSPATVQLLLLDIGEDIEEPAARLMPVGAAIGIAARSWATQLMVLG